MSNTKTFDLAIVGGGIVGALSAYYALQSGSFDSIVLFEKSLVGYGATFFSLALDLPFGSNPSKHQLSSESLKLWPELQEAMPRLSRRPLRLYPVTKKTPQELQTFLIEQELSPLKSTLQLPFSLNLKTHQLLYQPIKSWCSTPFQDVHVILKTCLQDARLKLYESSQIDQIETSANKNLLQLKNGNSYEAKNVILAVGPWLSTIKLQPQYQFPYEITTKKIVSLHFAYPVSKDDPVIFLFDEDAFLLPDPDFNRYIFSYTVQDWHVDPDRLATDLSSQEIQEGLTLLQSYAPALVQNFTGGRVFCDSYATTWEPLIYRGNHDNITILTGASGSGFRLAPAMALQAVQSLTSQRSNHETLSV